MKSTSRILILVIIAATVFAVTETTQVDEKLIDFIETFRSVSPDESVDDSSSNPQIKSRYMHMADDLADSGLSGGMNG